MNAPEARTLFDESSAHNQITAAVNGWISKNPQHTREALAEAEAEIRSRILESRSKGKYLNSKPVRDLRKSGVATLIAEHGWEYVTVKQTVEVKGSGRNQEAPRNVFEAFLYEMISDFDTHFVDRTVSFLFHKSRAGKAFCLEYAIALQNPADTPDSLVAKELVVTRMLEGKTIKMYMKDDSSAMSDAAQFLIENGALELYSQAYL
jgi:hypothetical protein